MNISRENICLTNGSQFSFFLLFNLFAGEYTNGKKKKILFPLAPEYIGYTDLGLGDGLFQSYRSKIEFLDNHLFKYHIDFEALNITDEIAAICVSRPTNPSSNVLTDEEIHKLHEIAIKHEIPLIIDNAYGNPFPGLIYTQAKLFYSPNTILCMSLSKLGLPGTRTGIVIAESKIIKALASLNAILNLSPNNLGFLLTSELLSNSEIIRISKDLVRPYYEKKVKLALETFHQALKGLPYYIHKPEGAMFLWLYFPDLPGGSKLLYEKLKARGVLVVSGHYFFPGLEEDEWKHKQECIRVSYAQDDNMVQKGIQIIAEEVSKIYRS